MPDKDVITPERYSQGLTYQDYLQQMGDARPRFDEHEKAFRLSAADTKFFKDLRQRFGQIKVVAIGEDWCPDVHRGFPVMNAITQAGGMEMRIFPRDKNLDIMNLYLKDGKFQSIPVFAFFDKELHPLCHWIERPEAANRFMEQISAKLAKEKLSEEEIRKERRKQTGPMAEEWRQETVKELKELLTKAISRS